MDTETRTAHFADLNSQLSDEEQARLISTIKETRFPICGICHGVPITPFMDTGCGTGHRHGACANCLQQWHANDDTRPCPLGCGNDVTMPYGGYTREHPGFNSWIDSQEVLCPREGCTFTGTAITITEHLTSRCEYRKVTECLNSHKGCSHTVAIGIPWHKMKADHCMAVCGKRHVKCPFVDCPEDWEGTYDDLQDHLDTPHAGAVQQYMRQMNEKQRKTVEELTNVKSELSAFKTQVAPLIALVPALKTFLEEKAPGIVVKGDLDPLVEKVSSGKRKRAGKWAPDDDCEEVTRRGRRRERKFMGIPKNDYTNWLAIKKKEITAPNPHWEATMAAAAPEDDDDLDDDE